MTCKCCGDRSKSEYCNFCSKLYFKTYEDKRIYREKPIVKKESKPLIKIACDACKEFYKPRSHRQKYCSDKCKPKPKTEAEKWLTNKTPKGNGMDSNQVAYGFFRKKYGVSKRYSACRG